MEIVTIKSCEPDGTLGAAYSEAVEWTKKLFGSVGVSELDEMTTAAPASFVLGRFCVHRLGSKGKSHGLETQILRGDIDNYSLPHT